MHAAGTFAPDTGAAIGVELAFGFLLLVAFFAGKLVEYAKSPKLTGYILVGVVAGPFFAPYLISKPMMLNLEIIQRVAVCLIALTAGAELSVEKMKPLMKTIKGITIWAVLATTFLIAGTIYGLIEVGLLPFLSDLDTTAKVAVCMMIAIVLASQSPAVVMALLEETRADGPLSQVSLAVVVIADLLVIVLYALFSSVAAAVAGEGGDIAGTVFTVFLEVIVSPVLGLVIGYLVAIYLQYVKGGAALFVLAVCIVVAELSKAIHLDALMVMLATGLYLENISKVNCHKLIEELESASLPVYLVFFSLVGAGLNVFELWSMIIPAAIIAVIRGLGFWKGCAYATKKSGAEESVQKYGWIGLLPQAGLALALVLHLSKNFSGVAADGTATGFGGQAAVLILAVVGLNQLVTPIMLRFALVKSGEAGKRATHEFGDEHH